MRKLMNRRTGRLFAVSAAALVLVGGTLGGAQAASARPNIPDCGPPTASLTGYSNEVVASLTEMCAQPDGAVIIYDFPVSLSRLVNGTWVSLASGEGYAVHLCVGTKSYEYSGAGHTATFACG